MSENVRKFVTPPLVGNVTNPMSWIWKTDNNFLLEFSLKKGKNLGKSLPSSTYSCNFMSPFINKIEHHNLFQKHWDLVPVGITPRNVLVKSELQTQQANADWPMSQTFDDILYEWRCLPKIYIRCCLIIIFYRMTS